MAWEAGRDRAETRPGAASIGRVRFASFVDAGGIESIAMMTRSLLLRTRTQLLGALALSASLVGSLIASGAGHAAHADRVPSKTKAVTPAPPKLPDLPAPPDVAASPADAEKSASGLSSKLIQKGTGTVHPKATDNVECRYSGWMTDGKLFDTSEKKGAGATAKFPLNLVIKGWTEGLQLMVVGEKRRFWIPANLAYGDTPRRPGGPHGTLVFDVELVSINPPEAPKAN